MRIQSFDENTLGGFKFQFFELSMWEPKLHFHRNHYETALGLGFMSVRYYHNQTPVEQEYAHFTPTPVAENMNPYTPPHVREWESVN